MSQGSETPQSPQTNENESACCAMCGKPLPLRGGYVDVMRKKMYCNKHCLFEHTIAKQEPLHTRKTE